MSAFREKLRQALDDEAASLDAATLSRLHRARVRALRAKPLWWQNPVVLATATASMASIVAWLLLTPIDTNLEQLPQSVGNDPDEVMEIMTLNVDLELMEDMDFYNWLDQQMDLETDA